MKKSLITFSTVDGHTKLICKKIAEYSANKNVEVIPISQINDLNLSIFIIFLVFIT